MPHRRHTNAEITEALEQSRSWAEAAKKLGMTVSGASYRRLQTFARHNNINVSHMPGQGWARGKRKDSE